MILGVGTDVVQIERIRKVYEQFSDRFLKKCFHTSEIKEFNKAPSSQKISFLAKRFAAKEAVAKAFGTGFIDHVRLSQIYVVRNKMGKPEVRLDGETAVFFETLYLGPKKIHLSLSDEVAYAIAFVIIETLN
jgi:holo-[acyl-carrier protein] synthase